MKSMRFLLPLVVALAITSSPTKPAQAQTLTTLANFTNTNGGRPLYGSLVQATNGNYYGTTNFGGKNDNGTVFEITPSGKLTSIYSFCSHANCGDGAYPWSSLVLGSNGNLYGTTSLGGAYNGGTIFKMTLAGKITTLHNFCPGGNLCPDGAYPTGLMQGSNGNFYGAASSAGVNGSGTLFGMSADGKFKVLYSFCTQTNCVDGSYPLSAPMEATDGNLYGTTNTGGSYNSISGTGGGTVYEITPAGQFNTLYSFCAQTHCTDGSHPLAGLTQGENGDLYGTTVDGGANTFGTVFEITTTHQILTLHSFDNTDGEYPVSGLIQANDGNFYGTVEFGGPGLSGGTIYEVTSAGMFISLYNFCGVSRCTGYYPGYTLAQATNGELIGTTGTNISDGTVFSFSTGLGPLVETLPKAAKIGARVIILGNGLTGSTSVAFNGTAAAFKVISDTEVTATVPTGATTGKVAVTTPTGTLYSNAAFQVTK